MAHGLLVEHIVSVAVLDNQGIATDSWLNTTFTPLVPRGCEAVLQRVRIGAFIQGQGDELTESQIAQVLLMPIGKTMSGDPSVSLDVIAEIEERIPLWSGHTGHLFEAGATDTANVVAPIGQIDIELDFHDEPRGLSKGTAIRNTGTISNVGNGWRIASRAISANTNLYMVAVAEWDLRWLETSRSTQANWDLVGLEDEQQVYT